MRLEPATTALIVVDVQPDFLPGGALPVPDGDAVLPLVAALLAAPTFETRVAAQDWHPPGHVSFASRHGRAPGDDVVTRGRRHVLWPDHCVQGTPGAALHPDVDWRTLDAVVRKGADPDVNAHSGLRESAGLDGMRRPTGLGGYLRERGVCTVVLAGLARDVCVLWTARDAVAAGFRVVVAKDATRPVRPDHAPRVDAELALLGATSADTATLLGR